MLRRFWSWLTAPKGKAPQVEIYPDARRASRALKDLNLYVGMPVAIVYRTKHSGPHGGEIVIKGMIVGVKKNPPRLGVATYGEVIMLDLHRVAAVTIIHEETP